MGKFEQGYAAGSRTTRLTARHRQRLTRHVASRLSVWNSRGRAIVRTDGTYQSRLARFWSMCDDAGRLLTGQTWRGRDFDVSAVVSREFKSRDLHCCGERRFRENALIAFRGRSRFCRVQHVVVLRCTKNIHILGFLMALDANLAPNFDLYRRCRSIPAAATATGEPKPVKWPN